MNLLERLDSPTPRFFKKLRNAALVLSGVSAAIIGSPVAFPTVVISIAGYLAVAGAIAGAVSQAAITDERS